MDAEKIALKTLMLSLAIVLIVEVLTWLAVSRCGTPPLISIGAARIVDIALLLLTVSSGAYGLAGIGLSWAGISRGVRRGLLWSIGFGVLVLIVYGILLIAGADPLSYVRGSLPSDTAGIVAIFLVGGVIGPVAEEVFFRGVIYGYAHRWGILPALFVSTILFVGAHSVTSGFPLPQLVGGILFALAYEVEKNLLVPITIHVLGNLVLFTLPLMF